MDHETDIVRTCIVDDHPLIRDGLRLLLAMAEGYEVAGTAGDVAGGRALLLEQRPDVAIVDARLPDGSGLDLVRSVRQRAPQVMCLVMTSYPSGESFREAVRSGASGYVSKDASNDALLEALRRVVHGGTALHWHAHEEPDGAVPIPEPRPSDLIEALTPRERRILDLITQGCTNREIAAELFLAEKTVRNYVSNLLGKLGLRNRTQAATLMARQADRQAWAVARR